MSGMKLILLSGEAAELFLLMMLTFSTFDIWSSFLKSFLKSQNSYQHIFKNKPISVIV